ncbi:MAG: 4,5-DOPA dioxygenase extradiol [Sphingomonas sp.]
MARLPALFIGHGSPMIALERNAVTATWRAIAAGIERPRAILAISAHWLTPQTAVTAMAAPRTIHDFGAFPQALFDVRYPAPGDPVLAARVRDLLAPLPVTMDSRWGLDHGTWSVLVHAFPHADVPVVQLGMDVNLSEQGRFDIGRALRPLRDEGVLILGTGNIVHNLPAMDWGNPDVTPYDWSTRFNDHIRTAIRDDAPDRVIGYRSLGQDAQRAVPDPDHFWPLLYVLGARHADESVRFDPDFIHHGSLGMTSILFGTD